ncbi:hypothetical protein AVEN_100856-1 [Araneus ventricosus]|uniref:Uncharacterized protein n=1 Tax=Araneus ventricosus TaxID=182803 RepID=A0A4Y2AXR4_ARAVE|nr:hypothetical protein AVEN_100856-1 [Araneus ventricosus]
MTRPMRYLVKISSHRRFRNEDHGAISRPFTSQINWIFWNARTKKPSKSIEISQMTCGGWNSGLNSERKIRGTLKDLREKNNALRRWKPRFEGSIN